MEPINIILELMNKRHVSAAQLTREAGITNGLITQWKQGKSKPSAKSLQKIADYFGVSVDYLLSGEQNDPKKSPELQPEEDEEADIDINDIMFAFSGEVKSEISQEERDAIVAVARLAKKARKLREDAKRKETNGGGQA